LIRKPLVSFAFLPILSSSNLHFQGLVFRQIFPLKYSPELDKMKTIGLVLLTLFASAGAFAQLTSSQAVLANSDKQVIKSVSHRSWSEAEANKPEMGVADQYESAGNFTKWINDPDKSDQVEPSQDNPKGGKPAKEVKKVAKTRSQPKPARVDRQRARGNNANRPSARRPHGPGRAGGPGHPMKNK
jgi:hypothetical protein